MRYDFRSLDSVPLTLPVGLIVGIVVVLVIRYAKSPWRRVPPGPSGFPILGNASKLRDMPWLLGQDCKKQFNEMMYCNAMGQPIIVINSHKVAAELLGRRANIYSDRPRLIVANDILCGGLLYAFMPYGDLWRRTRRAAHESLTRSTVRDYHPILHKEAILLASALLDSPEAREKHFQRSAASETMSILYDYPTLKTENDKTLKEIHAFNDYVSEAAVPGAHLVELFPWMMLIPDSLAKWKREGKRYFIGYTNMFEGLFNNVRAEISKGSNRPSVSASLIKNSERNGLSNQEMAWLVGSLYSAGAETTYTAMNWFVLAMITQPEIQKRAQAELDAVVGRARTPAFSDASSLPYIQAVVKEVLRWRPPLPLSIPHSTTEDDWYNGMFIPKGTICLPNIWLCHHDPAFYGDDAANFNPGRFLDAEGKTATGTPEARDDGHSTYGFGRRACPGKHVANDSLFIFIATVLWASNLERVYDQDGKETPLDMNSFIYNGVACRPVSYECTIKTRFPEALSILAEEKELLKT
ncbi:cytochrome P450 [Lactarius indigo]|nr:cytochrome P450 [Lactarius indigo]